MQSSANLDLTRPRRGAPPRLAAIQAPVRDLLDSVSDEIRRIVLSDFEMIEDVNEHLLFIQGKLFRPALLLLSSRVGEGAEGQRGEAAGATGAGAQAARGGDGAKVAARAAKPDPALTLAAVVELVHLATLVHDDAVDHSVLRRGLPTVNALWTHQVAIIMGDYLYSRGVSELARVGNLEALAVLANAANEMSIGEMRQLMSYDALDFTEDDYYRLIAAKTASLMSAACEMGALSGAPAYREALRRYGHNLGMAFQIADDLLDYTGSEDVTGKPTGHDLRERKVTLPLVGAMARADAAETDEIRTFFMRVDPSDDEIARIVEIVMERGGLDYARGRAAHYADGAFAALEGLPESEALEALRAAIIYAVDRRR